MDVKEKKAVVKFMMKAIGMDIVVDNELLNKNDISDEIINSEAVVNARIELKRMSEEDRLKAVIAIAAKSLRATQLFDVSDTLIDINHDHCDWCKDNDKIKGNFNHEDLERAIES